MSVHTVAISALAAFGLFGCVVDSSSVIAISTRSGKEPRGAQNSRVHAVCEEVARRNSLQEHLLTYGTPQEYRGFGRPERYGFSDLSIYIQPGHSPGELAQVSVHDYAITASTRLKIAGELQLGLTREFGEDRIRAFVYRGVDF